MEARKLQWTGGGTYTLSLPKKWAKKLSLGKGSLVGIDEREDGSLVIRPRLERKREREEALVSANDKPPNLLLREIISHYINGADVITLTGKLEWKLRKRLKAELASTLTGIQIVEESDTSMVIESIADPAELPPSRLLRRVEHITFWMYERGIEALLSQDGMLCDEVIEMDDEVDRLLMFNSRKALKIMRIPELRDRLGMGSIDALDHKFMVNQLENIADLCTEMAGATKGILDVRVPLKLMGEVKALGASVGRLQKDAMRSFYKRDMALANDVIERSERIYRERIPAFLLDLLSPDYHKEKDGIALATALSDIAMVLRVISRLCGDMAERSLNVSVRG